MKRLTVFAAVVLSGLAGTERRDGRPGDAAPRAGAGFFGEGHRQDARQHLVARKEGSTDVAGAQPRRRGKNILVAAWLPRAARGRRAVDRVADHRRLRSRRPDVGSRAPGVSSGHVRARYPGSRLRCRRSRGRGRGRQNGQTDGVCRSPGIAARAEGPRPWRSRRRTAKPLAHEGHRRRPSSRHEGGRLQELRAFHRRDRAQREWPALGHGQRVVHVRVERKPAIEEWPVRGAAIALQGPVAGLAGRCRACVSQRERRAAVR